MLRIAARYANQALFFAPPPSEATLGSAPGNDFVVPFPGISRQHARLTRRAEGLWISDLGSKNGLLRGDQRHAELLEADLFGVEARVATGVDPRPGLFAKAEGGTLVLDEIGDMAERLQAKLLRVLQEREVLSVGAHHPRKIKVRVISASNQNLAQRVEAGTFRADLYYRLRGLQFHLPPLRERKDDLPALVLAFAHEAANRYDKEIHGVSRKALDLLTAYAWPGNVRELKNEVGRAVLLAKAGGHLESEHFGPVRYAVEHATAPAQHAETPTSPVSASTDSQIDPAPRALHGRLDAVERQAISEALLLSQGNKSKAAQILGITRNGLALKMKRLGNLV